MNLTIKKMNGGTVKYQDYFTSTEILKGIKGSHGHHAGVIAISGASRNDNFETNLFFTDWG